MKNHIVFSGLLAAGVLSLALILMIAPVAHAQTIPSTSLPSTYIPSTNSPVSSGGGGGGGSTSCYHWSAYLGLRSHGADVVALQVWLMANGYNIPLISQGTATRGYFGPSTATAVRKLQSYVGIPASGYVGDRTITYLNQHACGTPTAVSSPQFSLVGTPTIVQQVLSPNQNGYLTTTYMATFNVQVMAVGGSVSFGLPNSQNPAFPSLGSNLGSWTIYKNGIADVASNYPNAFVTYSAPTASILSSDGTAFTVSRNNSVTIPVTLMFSVANPGPNVYGVRLNGIDWLIPGSNINNFTNEQDWATSGAGYGSTASNLHLFTPTPGAVIPAGTPYQITWQATQDIISSHPKVNIELVGFTSNGCDPFGCGMMPPKATLAMDLLNLLGIHEAHAQALSSQLVIAQNVSLSSGSYLWNVPSNITNEVSSYNNQYKIFFVDPATNQQILPYNDNVFAFGLSSSGGVGGASFSIAGTPTITETNVSAGGATTTTVMVMATFNVQAMAIGQDVSLGLRNSANPAFSGSDLNQLGVYTNGVLSTLSAYLPITASYFQPVNTTLSSDGTSFIIARNNSVTIPVTYAFTVNNPGANVCAVQMRGIAWSAVGSASTNVDGSMANNPAWRTISLSCGSPNAVPAATTIPAGNYVNLYLDSTSPLNSTVQVTDTVNNQYLNLPVLVFDLNATGGIPARLSGLSINFNSPPPSAGRGAIGAAYLYQGSTLISSASVSNGVSATFSNIATGTVGTSLPVNTTVPYTIKVDVTSVNSQGFPLIAAVGGVTVKDTNGNSLGVAGVANGNQITIVSGSTTQPSITLSSLRGGQTFALGTPTTISWSGGPFSSQVTAILFSGNSTPTNNTQVGFIGTSVQGASSLVWDGKTVCPYGTSGPQCFIISPGQYKIFLTAFTGSGNNTATDISDSPFTITSGTPVSNFVNLLVVPTYSNGNQTVGIRASIKGDIGNKNISKWTLDISCTPGIKMPTPNSRELCNTQQTYYGYNYYDVTQDIVLLTVNASNTGIPVNSNPNVTFVLTGYGTNSSIFGSDKEIVPLGFTNTQPPITVVSPNGGEKWVRGTTQYISWTGITGSLNQTGDIKLEFAVPTCAEPTANPRCMIAVRAPIFIASGVNLNSGSYAWNVGNSVSLAIPCSPSATSCPNQMTPIADGQYKIQICPTNVNSSTQCDDSNNYFTITSAPSITQPTITSVVPSSASVGSMVTIKGSNLLFAGSALNTSVTFNNAQTDSGTAPSTISYDGTTVTFAVPSLPVGAYNVSVEGVGISGRSNYLPFTITSNTTNRPPVISGGTFPTTLNVGQIGTWTINASDPQNGSLSYSVNWGDQPTVLPGTGVMSSSVVQTSTFTHSYSSAGTYTITFTVKNAAGLTAQTSTTVQVGSVAHSAPQITSIVGPSVLTATSAGIWTVYVYDSDSNSVGVSADWGDGSLPSSGGSGGSTIGYSGSVSLGHQYTQNGVYRITFTAKDESGLTVQKSATVQIGVQMPTTTPILNSSNDYQSPASSSSLTSSIWDAIRQYFAGQ